MAYVKGDTKDKLDKIKENVRQSHDYFRLNYQRFHDYITFIFKTSLSPADKSVLMEIQKPMMEFNITEAYISRLCGEFSKMDPAFSVRAAEGVQIADPRVIELVEAHMKASFMGKDKDSLSYRLYRDLLSGGFSVAELYTEYANSKSFDQVICVDRVFDPTLCGFDPLARKSHKGDGRYCYQLFPKTADEAKEKYGNDVVKAESFTRETDGFNWSYKSQREDIMLFCEYFEKKIKKTKIVKLANGHVVTESSYNKFLATWEEQGIIEQPPVVLKSRIADVETIMKYTVCGNTILEQETTSFDILPLVFFDGNSVLIQSSNGGAVEQMTRPYVYHTRDAQKMKNFAGQSWCNEIETTIQHKWTAPIEAIPDNADYQLAYTNPQKATILLYNQWKDNDPQQQINPPREVARVPMPPEIMQAFLSADDVIQNILGSYDAAQGINDNDTSGVAIMQGAMHSNAAAMPYTKGFIEGWNRLGEGYLGLLPKYYVTPRTIPITLPNGKHEYYEVNKQGNVKFDYDTNALEVNVEAGVNFAVQKQIALKTIVSLMGASEQFAQFMNTEGLEVLLDNIDIRGIDNIKAMAAQFMEQQKQAQQQAMEAQKNQPDPAQMMQMQMQIEQAKVQGEQQKVMIQAQTEQAKLAQKQQEAEMKAQVDLTKISTDDAVKNKELDIKFLEVMSKVQNADVELALKQEQTDAQNARTAVDMAVSVAAHHNNTIDMHHGHEMSHKEHEHAKMVEAKKPKGESK